MSQNHRFSDEFLNAFVDDQLDGEEKDRAYLEIGQDETINRQVCELRKLRDLTQHAYRDLPAPPSATTAAGKRRAGSRFGIAACLVLAFGTVLGLQIDAPRLAATAPAGDTDPATAAETTAAASVVTARPATTASPTRAAPRTVAATSVPTVGASVASDIRNKVIVHIADDKPVQLEQALGDIESLLRYYRDSHETARVQVVLNGRGVGLVRADTSAFAARIARLQKEYDNLTFAACQNTLERLHAEQGVAIRLLPGVIVIDSGVAEIMRRQSQGWTYLQV